MLVERTWVILPSRSTGTPKKAALDTQCPALDEEQPVIMEQPVLDDQAVLDNLAVQTVQQQAKWEQQ